MLLDPRDDALQIFYGWRNLPELLFLQITHISIAAQTS